MTRNRPATRVAVDIGGTFTDFVLLDSKNGGFRVGKVLSTPENPSIGIVRGLRRLGIDMASVEFFVHGTTVGINAVVEGKGEPVALVTTRGFRDVLEIGRMEKPEMYDIFYRRPRPLVPRRHRFEVGERVDALGTVIRSLDEDEVAAIARRIEAAGIRSIAICTLNSYVNPENERVLAKRLTALLPDAYVSVSHEIVNEWREYERTSTTVLNAYVLPVFRTYLDRVTADLGELGMDAEVHIMQSSGGIVTAKAVVSRPIHCLLSGPVGGAVGARAIGSLYRRNGRSGAPNIVTADMGGTSFDACLIIEGHVETASQTEIADFPLLVPAVRVSTIGAGGGSIARVEGSSGLRVGPESAGANPGPVCYGAGGVEPTVTDANLVLGRLDPEDMLAGEIALDADAAAQALREKVADPLRLDLYEAAGGVIRVINSKMALALRELTVAQGLDPREFVLVAFGGAGPMHAAEICREIGIPRIVVPPVPGMFSAWGMLTADLRHDHVTTSVEKAENLSAARLAEFFAKLEQSAGQALRAQNVPDQRITFARSLDLRYVGQEHTLNVPVSPAIQPAQLKALFDEAHRRKYGHASKADPVEVVNYRVAAIGAVHKPEVARPAEAAPTEVPAARERPVYFEGRFVTTPVYRRSELPAGFSADGPAIVEEDGATTIVPPGFEFVVDESANMMLFDKRGRQK